MVFKNQNIEEIIADIQSANYFFITLSSITVLLAHFIRALRWQLLIETLGEKAKLKYTFYAVMVGYLANLALPRLGEASRCGVLKNKININFTALFGTVITERLVDLLSLILLIFFSVIIEFDLVFKFLKQILYQIPYQYIFLLLASVCFISYLIIYFFKANKGQVLSRKLIGIYDQFKVGFQSFKYLKNKNLFITYTFTLWFLYILSVYIAFFALKNTNGLGFNAAISVIVFGSLGMIVPVQGGIGAFHFMVSQALVFYGINKTTGISLATLMHSSQTLLIIVIGFACLFLILAKSKKSMHYESVSSS